MIKAIIFDFDDTLIATIKGAYEKHMVVGRKLGMPKVSRRRFLECWGPPWQKLLPMLWDDVSYSDFKKTYINMFEKHSKYTMIKGARQTLEKLAKKGYPLYILTSRDKTTLAKVMKYLNLNSHFIGIHAMEHGKFHKPDPRVFTGFLRKHKLKAKECLYIGDLTIDYQAASNAGLQHVSVTTGSHNKAKFLKEGIKSTTILRSVKDLPTWLEKNYGKS